MSTTTETVVMPFGLSAGDGVRITTDSFAGAGINVGDVGAAIEWDGTFLVVRLQGGLSFPFRVTEVVPCPVVPDDELRGAYVGDGEAVQVLPEGTVLRSLDDESRVFTLFQGEWYTAGYAAAMNNTVGIFARSFGLVVLDAPGFSAKAA